MARSLIAVTLDVESDTFTTRVTPPLDVDVESGLARAPNSTAATTAGANPASAVRDQVTGQDVVGCSAAPSRDHRRPAATTASPTPHRPPGRTVTTRAPERGCTGRPARMAVGRRPRRRASNSTQVEATDPIAANAPSMARS